MTRGTYVMRNGKLVPKHLAPPKHAGKSRQVISDDLGADLEHMAFDDGRRTASKSVFRRWTRESGCVEKGNDREVSQRQFGADTSHVKRDVTEAIQMVRQGYKPTLGREWD